MCARSPDGCIVQWWWSTWRVPCATAMPAFHVHKHPGSLRHLCYNRLVQWHVRQSSLASTARHTCIPGRLERHAVQGTSCVVRVKGRIRGKRRGSNGLQCKSEQNVQVACIRPPSRQICMHCKTDACVAGVPQLAPAAMRAGLKPPNHSVILYICMLVHACAHG